MRLAEAKLLLGTVVSVDAVGIILSTVKVEISEPRGLRNLRFFFASFGSGGAGSHSPWPRLQTVASKHLGEAPPRCHKKEGGIRWTPPFAFRAAKLTPVLGVFATCIIAGLPAAPGLRLSPGVCFSPSSQVGSSVASCRPYILSAGSCPSLS